MSNNHTIQTKIITPAGVVFSGSVSRINTKTTSGEITILPDHAPLVSTIKDGHIRFEAEGETQKYMISNGVLEIRQNSEVIFLISDAVKKN